jgi:peptidoglycan-N-acetylglucosamine deacetylase
MTSRSAVRERRGWRAPIRHGARTQQRVALTFDDGPNDPHTLRVADALERAGVRGTFFVVGKAVDARPDIVAALHARGHLIASHAYSHRKIATLAPAYPELARTQRTIVARIGVAPAFFRPPYGVWTPFVLAAAARAGLRVVNWDVITSDWSLRDSARIARNIVDTVRPGSIVVLHDGGEGDLVADRSATVAALPAILAGLRERALEPVRLDELLGGPAYLPTGDD